MSKKVKIAKMVIQFPDGTEKEVLEQLFGVTPNTQVPIVIERERWPGYPNPVWVSEPSITYDPGIKPSAPTVWCCGKPE